jgi:hypothetical protein
MLRRDVYNILVEKSVGKRLLTKHKSKCKGKIKIDRKRKMWIELIWLGVGSGGKPL